MMNSEKNEHVCWRGQNTVLCGNLKLHDNVNIWHNTVIRADADSIEIGPETNVQDGCILHTDKGHPVQIGRSVTIGHGAIVHGCTIGDNSLVGMGAIVMNGAKIGRNCLIGAGALISENKEIPDGSLVMGMPGKVIRKLSTEEIASLKDNADEYVQEARSALTPHPLV